MKKTVLGLLLSVMLICVSVVPVFADVIAEPTPSPTEYSVGGSMLPIATVLVVIAVIATVVVLIKKRGGKK